MSFADALQNYQQQVIQSPMGSFFDPRSGETYGLDEIDRVEWTFGGSKYRSDRHYVNPPSEGSLMRADSITIRLDNAAPVRYSREDLDRIENENFNETFEPLIEYVFPS